MVLIAAVITLIGLGSAGAAERRQICFSCRSSTANSQCHLEPPRKGDFTERCSVRPAHCVTERIQTEDGTFVSIERRCSTLDETKLAHNKCVKTDNRLQRCMTMCYGSFCNAGTGQLFQHPEDPWDYDDPEYSDNIYDPHEAVLSPRKQRPFSGPLPVGTAHAQHIPAGRQATQQEWERDDSRTISRSGPVAGAGARVAARGAGVMVKGEMLSMLVAAMMVLWWR